jgi:hypothetical protein
MLLHYGVNRGEELENPWRILESWTLRAHGAAAMAALAVFGSMLPAHVPAAWNRGLSRASGIGMAASLALFAVTGWLLYYAPGDAVREWSGWLHMAFGTASPFALVWHLAQRSRKPLVDAERNREND